MTLPPLGVSTIQNQRRRRRIAARVCRPGPRVEVVDMRVAAAVAAVVYIPIAFFPTDGSVPCSTPVASVTSSREDVFTHASVSGGRISPAAAVNHVVACAGGAGSSSIVRSAAVSVATRSRTGHHRISVVLVTAGRIERIAFCCQSVTGSRSIPTRQRVSTDGVCFRRTVTSQCGIPCVEVCQTTRRQRRHLNGVWHPFHDALPRLIVLIVHTHSRRLAVRLWICTGDVRQPCRLRRQWRKPRITVAGRYHRTGRRQTFAVTQRY